MKNLLFFLLIISTQTLQANAELPADQILKLKSEFCVHCSQDKNRSQMDRAEELFEKLSKSILVLGMSKSEVETIFGKPSRTSEQEISRWRDVRCQNEVEAWFFASSYSGTSADVLIFANGRLIYFGPFMQRAIGDVFGDPTSFGSQYLAPGKFEEEFKNENGHFADTYAFTCSPSNKP